MSEEQWRTLPEFPRYAISDHGRVMGLDKARTRSAGRILKGWANHPAGYWVVQLREGIDGKLRFVKVHRLVLMAFVGEGDEGQQVNHKDGCKTNNHLSNLEWVSPSENRLHAYRTGLQKNPKGHLSPYAKLKDGEIWLIRRLLRNGVRKTLVAKMFKVHFATISLINRGKTYQNSGHELAEA